MCKLIIIIVFLFPKLLLKTFEKLFCMLPFQETFLQNLTGVKSDTCYCYCGMDIILGLMVVFLDINV
jgi:hypothetical protein